LKLPIAEPLSHQGAGPGTCIVVFRWPAAQEASASERDDQLFVEYLPPFVHPDPGLSVRKTAPRKHTRHVRHGVEGRKLSERRFARYETMFTLYRACKSARTCLRALLSICFPYRTDLLMMRVSPTVTARPLRRSGRDRDKARASATSWESRAS
jgi:hypothetical protein